MKTTRTTGAVARRNILGLMIKGLSITEMVEPLARIEGKKTTIVNIYMRIKRMLINKAVSAERVRVWKKAHGENEARKIIKRYGLQ